MKISPRSLIAALGMIAFCALASVPTANAVDEPDLSSSPDTISLTDFQAASTVIGQPNFSSFSPNQGMGATPAADTIAGPFGAAAVSSGGVLYVSDYSNQRVLGFDSVPSSNDAAADFVLGQPNSTSAGKGTAANEFGGPQSVVLYQSKMIVADFYNNRVMIWKNAPTSSQAPANTVVGQSGFGNRVSTCTQTGMSAPETATVGGGKLVVPDASNSRVLIFKKIPIKNGAKANIVLGQPNFTSCNENQGGAPSNKNVGYPSAAWTDGKRLVVVDSDDNRVMIWKKFPTKNFQPANIVLGQPDFTSAVVNNNGSGGSGSPSASNMNYPYDGVFSNGTQLFVVDQMNNRVMVWNHFPTANFTAADVVLGQTSVSCGVANNDGSGCKTGAPSANNLNQPTGVYQFGSHLIVTDGSNNRYLIY